MQSTHDARKRSSVRQISKSPRFTAIDFYINPATSTGLVRIPVRGRAIQVISAIDFNALTVPVINGTDSEECHCVWPGSGSLAGGVLPVANLNGAGTIASFAAAAAAFTITTLSYHGPATLTLPAFTIVGACNPSGTAAVCNVAAGVQVAFPGGAAGVFILGFPAFTGAVVPACPGDATFTGNGAAIVISYVGNSTDYSVCGSTWAQPGSGTMSSAICGYVHLNVNNPHFVIPNGVGNVINQTAQTVPIPSAPILIRVEQEFDLVQIEPIGTGLCAGVLIVEHETEYDLR
jgi:hypothetical protein